MSIRFDTKILLLKLETTEGTDAAPTGAANAFVATDVVLTPMEGQDVSRNLDRPFLGGQPTIPVDLHSKLSFKVELEPSGVVATAPGWAPAVRAAAAAQTINAGVSVVYNPVSSGEEAVTIHLWIGGTRYVLLGTKMNIKVQIAASGIPYLECEATGFWTLPTDVARPVPVLSAFKDPKVATKANTPTFTVNGVALVLRSFTLNFGNQLTPAFLIGHERIDLSQKAESVEFQVRVKTMTDFNPYALAIAGTPVALQLIHGTTAGRKVQIDVPRLQLQRPGQMTQVNNIAEQVLRGVPLPNLGNDQWTITLN